MNETIHFLKSKQVKEVLAALQEQFGYSEKNDLVWAENNKDRLFVVNRDIDRLPLDELRINSVGVYIAERTKEGLLRLSIEGSEMVSKSASKNVIDIDEKRRDEWLKGEDIDFEGKERGYVILRCNGDVLGCGKVKNNSILNFVSKNRRVG